MVYNVNSKSFKKKQNIHSNKQHKKSEIMKKYVLIFGLTIIIGSTLAFEILSSSGKSGYTNSPGENNCTSCHSGTINSGPGSIEIKSDPSMENGYTPGTTYSMTVTVSNSQEPNNTKFGFALEALLENGSNGGKLSVTNTNLTQIQTASVNGNSRDNMIHTGSNNTGPGSQNFTFDWTAPATGDQKVIFYAVGNAANNNGNTSGDLIYASTLEVNSSTTNIYTNELANDINVFPNPSTGKFTLAVSDLNFSHYDLTVVNTTGSVIYHTTVEQTSTEIDLSNYPKGNYILRISNQEINSTKKISIY